MYILFHHACWKWKTYLFPTIHEKIRAIGIGKHT